MICKWQSCIVSSCCKGAWPHRLTSHDYNECRLCWGFFPQFFFILWSVVSVTYTEESVLLNLTTNRRPGLASVAMIERGDRVSSPSSRDQKNPFRPILLQETSETETLLTCCVALRLCFPQEEMNLKWSVHTEWFSVYQCGVMTVCGLWCEISGNLTITRLLHDDLLMKRFLEMKQKTPWSRFLPIKLFFFCLFLHPTQHTKPRPSPPTLLKNNKAGVLTHLRMVASLHRHADGPSQQFVPVRLGAPLAHQ